MRIVTKNRPKKYDKDNTLNTLIKNQPREVKPKIIKGQNYFWK